MNTKKTLRCLAAEAKEKGVWQRITETTVVSARRNTKRVTHYCYWRWASHSRMLRSYLGKITLNTPNLSFVRDKGDLMLGVVRMDAIAWFNGGAR